MSRHRTAAILALLLLLCAPACRRHRNAAASTALTSVAFLTRQEIDAGMPALRAVVCRDLTRNGLLDLITTSLVDRQVRVLIASSPGVWSASAGFQASYASPPGEVAAADFDNDGDVDFACLFTTEGTIRVYRNDGNGAFTEDTAVLATGATPSGLCAIDFESVGHADLAVAGNGGSHVLVFRSLGSGGFAQPLELSAEANGELAAVCAGDLNADGRPDLAASDLARNEIVVWYQGAQGFQQSQRQILAAGGLGPLSLAIDDVTADGVADLIVANYGSSSLTVFAGTGGGNFHPGTFVPLDGDPFHVTTGNLFGDGRRHIVASFLDRASIGVVRSLGAGGFEPRSQFGTSGLPTMSQVADLDRDGFADVIAAGLDSTFLSWLRGGGAAGLHGSQNFAPGGSAPSFTVAADFDGDALADAVVSDRDTGNCALMRGARDGSLAHVLDIAVGAQPGVMSKADLDGDGRQDVIVAVARGVRFLRNVANPTSRAGVTFEVLPPLSEPPFAAGAGPFEAVVGRFDNDALLDLAVADYGGDRVTVFRGAPGTIPFEATGSAIDVAGGPLSLVTGDFDADGARDLAVSRFRAGLVSVLRGDGRGAFTLWQNLASGPSPNYVRVADFDADGIDDFVVSNLGGSFLTLFRFKERVFVSTELVVGDGPTALLARDLNRDGRADILVANAASADFHVLLGDGRGGFPNVMRFPGTFRAISADLSDVDGDTLPDLVVASLFTNRISLYLNRSK